MSGFVDRRCVGTHYRIGRVLLTQQSIQKRVAELSIEIRKEYRKKPFMILGLLNGALFFVADLLRNLPLRTEVEFLQVKSYSGTSSRGYVQGLELIDKTRVASKHILVIDDILDTGLTLSTVREELYNAGASAVEFCVLLRKKKEGQKAIEPKWIGFEIPDEFVVGYGLDFEGMFRALKSIRSFSVNKENGGHIVSS
ncbi:hypoxanthine phosphoribosyltransferase [Methylacidiphilum caldifontis]|uniref:Hypoxanthine phosphoribosyltransferase n=1 Tax=Methylacidiphilum caldifontis TaxID=2795386 RepID=A0A4Y8PGU2_9BACT|nr:hypoxanthine phosphoribosyltransferase [Methylacidiphilum caldifontis]QSR88516.1 hypoxanthine phosphoribosyltransferase [Methylacidiphilum caldifontis]TFE71342.1 hypoxanthine phosphoribosyltransferase [Methylacidiphilum caldifontis]